MNLTFRPLPTWPYSETRPRRSAWTFKAGWQNTLALLNRELRMLGAENIIIGAGFREQDLRLDGLPLSNAREPSHPGIEISFECRHGRLVYATDACARWEHNVRSIALGLESLRAVDRYGITRRGEQYAGWRQLTTGGGISRIEAQELITSYGGITKALKATHPDAGGDPEAFQRVQEARKVLGAA